MSHDIVLIAGASSDIGIALIRRLLKSPGTVILAHHNTSVDRIKICQDESGGERIHPFQCDFAASDAIGETMDRLIDQFGVPNKIVYLPALRLRYERFTKFNVEHFNRDMNIQILAAILILKKLLPTMSKLARARVVFLLSSVVHGVPPKFLSMYTLIKHAQLGLMRALAVEYAATGVTVNAVSPSMVETRFLDDVPDLVKQMSASHSPKGRNALPEDLLGAIELLLSDESDFITGVDIPVTGGSAF